MSSSPSPATHVPAPAAQAVLQRIVDAPVTAQHVHPFVEGCTCGAGLVGCCPCALGAVAQPALSARGPVSPRRYGPPPPTPNASLAVPIAVGALSAAGVGFGVRAMLLNRQAHARVRESLEGVRAQRLAMDAIVQAKEALGPGTPVPSCCHSKGANRRTAETAFVELASYQERLQRLERRLTDSASERRFEMWVPGALQVVASAGGLVSLLPHAWLGAWHPMVVTSVGGAWALFGAAYAVHATSQGVRAIRQARALKAFVVAPDEKDHKIIERMRLRTQSLAQRTALARVLEAIAWLGFSAGAIAMALPQSSLLGLTIASKVGPHLGYGVLATGLGATLLSAYLRRPTHTMTLPLLREMPMDTRGEALAQVAERCLLRQKEALRLYVQEARNQYGSKAASLRMRMAWQHALYPSCGPKAYSAVAERAMHARRSAPLGEQALAKAVVHVLTAERDLLEEWLKQQKPKTDPELPDSDASLHDDVLAAALEMGATERRRPLLMQRRVRVLGELIAEWKVRKNRLPPEPRDLSDDERQTLRRQRRDEGRDLRLTTLMAMGLLGESLAAYAKSDTPSATTLPHLSPLAHLHVEPVPSHLSSLLDALRPEAEPLFVRVFCNPHRLDEASVVVDQELAALARARQSPSPARVARAPGCASCPG